jgi:hypothetical protein
MDDTDCFVIDGVRHCNWCGQPLCNHKSLEEENLEPTDTKEFVAVGTGIMYGDQCVGWARSNTMARRIAKALNEHLPNRKGV